MSTHQAEATSSAPSSTSYINASVLHGAKDLRIEKRLLPAPAPHELTIAIQATGLCGSDLHYFSHFRNGDILVKEPLSLGHESAGTVVGVGSAVQGFETGDRVALEVGLPCDTCERCTQGRYNLCKGMNFRSSARRVPHFQGTLQERLNHPAKWCYKLPPSITLETAALVEPLSVALHAVARSQLQPGTRVLVLGAGAIGLLTAAAARRSGAADIVIADIDEGRLSFATQHRFAHSSYLMPRRPRPTSDDESFANAKVDAAALVGVGARESDEFDVVYECTGVPSCIQTAIYASRPGGKLLLVGMGTSTLTLPIGAAQSREVDLLMVFRYAGTYASAVEMLAASSAGESSTAPDLRRLVTHVFDGLDKAPEAFDMAGRTREVDGGLVLKVVIREGKDAEEGR